MTTSNIASANTHFPFKLFAQLLRQDRDKNIFISPISVALALTMASNGAGGETRRAMAGVLELGGMSREGVNHASAEIMRALARHDPQVRLAIANSLWARKRSFSCSTRSISREIGPKGSTSL